MGHDAGPRPPRPAGECQHGMVMTIEVKSAFGLTHAFAEPAIFLNGLRRLEERRRLGVEAPIKAGIKKAVQAVEVFGVAHRPHRGLRSEDGPQRAREFLELGGQLVEQRRVVVAQAIARLEHPGGSGDFNGEEERQTLAAQVAPQHPLPVACEPLVAHPPDHRIGDALRLFVVAEEFRAIIRVAGPLELQPSSRSHQGEESPHLVLKCIQPFETRPAQVGRLQPETFGDDASAFRRAEQQQPVAKPPCRRTGVGFAQRLARRGPREMRAAEPVVHFIAAETGGFAVPQEERPGERREKGNRPDDAGHGPAGGHKKAQQGKESNGGRGRDDHGKVEVAFQSEDPAGGVVRRIGVRVSQFAHGQKRGVSAASCIPKMVNSAVMIAAAAAMMMPAMMPLLPSVSPLLMAFAPAQIFRTPQKNPTMNISARAMPKPSFNDWSWASGSTDQRAVVRER